MSIQGSPRLCSMIRATKRLVAHDSPRWPMPCRPPALPWKMCSNLPSSLALARFCKFPILGFLVAVSSLCLAQGGKTNQSAMHQSTAPIPIDLTTYFNNVGISSVDHPAADFDGKSNFYAADALPHAGTVTVFGIPFHFPQPGAKDNVISDGQTIPLTPGHYHDAAVLLASDGGDASGFIVVHYADGSTSSSPMSTLDWDWSARAGGLIGAIASHVAKAGEPPKQRVLANIFFTYLSIDPKRVAVGLTLPARVGKPRMHVFAMTIQPAVEGSAVRWISVTPTSKVEMAGAGQRAQIVEATLQNVGSTWFTPDHPLSVTLRDANMHMLAPVQLTALGPGEQARVTFEVAADGAVPAGAISTGEIQASSSGDLLASIPVRIRTGVPDYSPTLQSLSRHQTPDWYDGAKFGVFIVWGPYSVPAWAPVGTYAEWYWHALHTKNSPTYQYHLAHYGAQFAYHDFFPMLTASHFDPKAWVDLIYAAGARYFVFTSKFHDGFAMFPTATTNRNSMVLGPHQDIMGALFSAARKYQPSVHPGLYYSLYEWYNPAYTGRQPVDPFSEKPVPYAGYKPVKNYVSDSMLPQMNELIDRYDPALIWCDGQWEQNASYWDLGGVVAHYYNRAKDQAHPEGVAIDNRCKLVDSDSGKWNPDFMTPEYATYNIIIRKKWESSAGMGYSYGYNRNEKPTDYKTAKQLIDMLVDIVSKNGNFLLDIGPEADGTIPEIMRDRLLSIGAWLKVNGESIYGTQYWWRQAQENDLRFTLVPNKAFYITALQWPGNEMVIHAPVPIEATSTVSMLGCDCGNLHWKKQNGALVIDMPVKGKDISQDAWVVKIGYPQARK